MHRLSVATVINYVPTRVRLVFVVLLLFFFFLIFKLPNNTNLSCQESPRPVCYRVAPRAVCVCVSMFEHAFYFFSKWTNYYYYYYRTYTVYTVVVGCVCARDREWEKTERKTSRFDTLAYVIVRDCGPREGGTSFEEKKYINKRSS